MTAGLASVAAYMRAVQSHLSSWSTAIPTQATIHSNNHGLFWLFSDYGLKITTQCWLGETQT